MTQANKVLSAALPACQELDAMIRSLELNLGRNHSKSPFESMYAANGMSFSTIEKKAPA